jgi:hypothetical protein
MCSGLACRRLRAELQLWASNSFELTIEAVGVETESPAVGRNLFTVPMSYGFPLPSQFSGTKTPPMRISPDEPLR